MLTEETLTVCTLSLNHSVGSLGGIQKGNVFGGAAASEQMPGWQMLKPLRDEPVCMYPT